MTPREAGGTRRPLIVRVERTQVTASKPAVWRITAIALLMAGLGSTLFAAAPSHASPDRSQLVAAQAALDQLIQEQAAMGERYDAAAAHLQNTQAQLSLLDKKVSILRQKIAGQRQRATEVARSMYEQGSFADAQFLLSAESLGDLESRVQMLGSVTVAQHDIFRSLDAARSSLTKRIATLGRREEGEVTQEQKLADLKVALDTKVASQQQEIQHLQEVIARAEARARRRARLAAAEARKAAQATLAAARQSSAAIPVRGFTAHPAPATNPSAETAVRAALSQLGKPYVWGAVGPDSFDCSGLTMWAWAKAGVSLSHYSAAQYAETQRVDLKDLQPGDLVFYYHPIEHVAMYIGNGQMVEAPHTGAFVRAVPLRTGDFAGAGRPTAR